MRLPSADTLSYAKLLAETLIVLVALPLLLWAFLRDPRGAAARAVKGAAP